MARHLGVHRVLERSAVLPLLPVRPWAVQMLPVSAWMRARRRS
jgi:hypothetical protein